MHADDFVINDGSAWEAVEGVAECLPKLDTKPTAALVVESVDPIDARTLVVAPEDEKVFWILDLVRKQKTDNFKRLLTPVDVVSQEEIVRLGRKSPVFKQT